MITQEELKKLIHYDPETGIFVRLVTKNGGAVAGKEAGCLEKDGYRHIQIRGKKYFSHRLAFLYVTGHFPPEMVDHINNIRNDNRWKNLRMANCSQNQQNSSPRSDNKSGVTGVSWSKNYRKWWVQIKAQGFSYNLGFYDDLELAELIINEARVKYHGSFAFKNGRHPDGLQQLD